MKIELDEKTIDNIVDYAINNPSKIRKLIKLVGEETLSVLKERKIIDEGAMLYREITRAINNTYKKNNNNLGASTREGVNNASTSVNKVNISFEKGYRDNTIFNSPATSFIVHMYRNASASTSDITNTSILNNRIHNGATNGAVVRFHSG